MNAVARHGVEFRRLAAVATLAVVALLAPAGAAPAFAAEDELALVSRATYTLDPEAAAVRVAVAVTATNNKPDLVETTASGTRTTRYFYDGANLVIQSEATAVAARAGGADLAVRLTPEEGYTIAEVRFGRDVYFGQSIEFTLSYDLPGGPPRSESDIRVGSAFATFYAWAFGDRGDVTVAVPAGYEVETTGATVTETVAEGATLLSATAIADVPEWFVVVVADRHDSLTRERLDLPGGERLVIRAWPEDEEWLERVGGLLRIGLPVLVEKIGLAWPVDGEIEVAEVHTPLLEGYAGVFHTNEDLIEISEDLDELTIVHEASHAWFNSDLFVGRWINEGLADEYAARVLDEVSVGGLRPRGLSPSSEGAVRLNEWSHPGRIADEETDARETFGYEASWTVIRDLVDEIGEDGMKAVFAAAHARQVAYVGAREPEAVTIPNDWRRFLDLLEEIGGSASAEEMYRRWIVTTEQEAQLEERARAREAYAALVDVGDGWLPGFAVRDPLGRWQFARARERTEEAAAILAIRDDVAEVADRLGIDPPGSLRAAYQGATTEEELAAARAAANRQLAVATELATTAEAVRASRDPFTAIGLIGEEPDRDLEAAIAAFVSGHEDRAAAGAAEIRSLFDSADDTGRTRALAGGGLVLAGGGIAAAAAVWRRRRVAAAELAAPQDPAGDEPPEPAEAAPAGDPVEGEPAEAAPVAAPAGDPVEGEPAEAAPAAAPAAAPVPAPESSGLAAPEPAASVEPDPAEPTASPEGVRPYATLGGRRPSDPAEPPTAPTEPPTAEGDHHVRDGA